MTSDVSPQIKTQTLTLELQDPTLPPVFYAQLTTLRDSIIVNVGPGPPIASLPFAIAQDFACAMPVSDSSLHAVYFQLRLRLTLSLSHSRSLASIRSSCSYFSLTLSTIYFPHTEHETV